MQNTITALTTQKRNPNRVNVFLDGEFSFGLYIINAGHLKVGQTISQEMIDCLKKDDQIEDGFQKALKYISYKPRTKSEVVKKLKENDFDEEIISIVLDMLVEKGYVNDLQFAKNWVENRSIYKPRSKKLITWELKNKQIGEEIIREVTGEMLPEEKLAMLEIETAQKQSKPIVVFNTRDYRTIIPTIETVILIMGAAILLYPTTPAWSVYPGAEDICLV